jgi:hypothetical protein
MANAMSQDSHKESRGLRTTIVVLVLIAVAFYVAVFAKYW